LSRVFVPGLRQNIRTGAGDRNRGRGDVRILRDAACIRYRDRRSKARHFSASLCAEDTMVGIVEVRLAALGIALGEPVKPMANYVPPYVHTGDMLTMSGQPCLDGAGKLVAKLGGGVSIEDGQNAARACAISLITQVQAAVADLDKVTRVVRLGGFIKSAPGFTEGPKVMNGASDLLVEVFGEAGKDARSTVGIAALPADAAVELEGIFEVY
jgi:enamine deaminase RidA (YjgF/YER057c/UK114 family)